MMNGKERVKAALLHQTPDRVPYGEYSIDFDTVEKILGHETYLRAKAKCQIALWEGRRDEIAQSWKEDIVALYKQLDRIDIVNLMADACGILPSKNYTPLHPKKIDSNTWEDAEGKIYKYSDISKDIAMVHDPNMWEREYKIEDYGPVRPMPEPDESMFEVVDHVIDKLGKEKFILSYGGREVGMVLLGGMERGFTEMAMNPEVVRAAIDYEIKAGNREDFSYIRRGVDGVFWGQDFSYNSGPMMSPDMFREFVLPAAKARAEHVKENFGLPVFKHACGNNWKLLDMFTQIGYDCYQSVQPSAGMDIKEVKKAYGDKLCLWGGINVVNLISGSKEDIRKDIRYAVENASGGGGFILGSSHSIAVGANYDNFMTVLEEVQKL